MDYSENVKASKKADLVYAKWYGQQPDERKASMILSGYKMVANNIQANVKKANPFSNEADVLLQFMELTHKRDYSTEMLAFIREKMAARSEAEWKTRFKAMKKNLGWSYDDMARFIGAANGDSIKASVNRQLPAFAKLAVCVFEQLTNKVESGKTAL